jgi:hypothetical protein
MDRIEARKACSSANSPALRTRRLVDRQLMEFGPIALEIPLELFQRGWADLTLSPFSRKG